jgi:hypothetical protein
MTASPKQLILEGEPLLRALAQTAVPVRWLRRDGGRFHIPPDMAAAIVRGGIYDGKVRGDGRRVYFIREIDPRPEPERDDSFWHEMPALRNFRSLKAAAQADYSFSHEARARMQQLRHRDFLQDINRIPTGRWLPEE